MATRPCPRCAERIQQAASVCRFCRAEVEPVPEPVATAPIGVIDRAALGGYLWLVVTVIIAAACAAVLVLGVTLFG